jgi:peptide-methionine (S)-S-oxide reductase
MRKKYRSAVYYFEKEQKENIEKIITKFQSGFKEKIITKAYPFMEFKPSGEEFQNYYLKNPDKPFCRRYIIPKLSYILNKFGN